MLAENRRLDFLGSGADNGTANSKLENIANGGRVLRGRRPILHLDRQGPCAAGGRNGDAIIGERGVEAGIEETSIDRSAMKDVAASCGISKSRREERLEGLVECGAIERIGHFSCQWSVVSCQWLEVRRREEKTMEACRRRASD